MMIVVVTVNSGRVSSIGQSESLTHSLQVEVLPATPINNAKQMCLWVRASREHARTSHKSMPRETHQAGNPLSAKHNVTTVQSKDAGGAAAWHGKKSSFYFLFLSFFFGFWSFFLSNIECFPRQNS